MLWTDGWMLYRWLDGKNNVALAHPYYEGKSCSKFG